MSEYADFIITLFIILVVIIGCGIIGSIVYATAKEKLSKDSENESIDIIPPDSYPVNYDLTSGWIKTHIGTGKYVDYNGNTGKATLEMDYGYLVELDGRECYIESMIDERV
jgi:hypothetical protein